MKCTQNSFRYKFCTFTFTTHRTKEYFEENFKLMLIIYELAMQALVWDQQFGKIQIVRVISPLDYSAVSND